MEMTKSGTMIIEEIEFNEIPPSALKRATKREWGNALIQRGSIRMNSLAYLRNLEDVQRGDENEGKSLYLLNGHPMTTDSMNEVYAWCTSEESVRDEDIRGMFQGTDTVLRIKDPMELARRIARAARAEKAVDRHLRLHCGFVKYTHGDSITKDSLNNQLWHYNVFQKDKRRFHSQREYRFSLTNVSFNRIDKDHLDLEVGYCGNIVSIA